ncbi:uncharacterized protein Cnot4 isoform X1 [Tribolium castaneum]|uniref:CCR4-NOT transcription complex subunit 4 n=1 Tax=Tribolium castaneum TaxID=7070 RepID=A0A139WG52_TRICA|nr:PREDICTED: uncharacterized protein LOC661055 isoform X1 [Tribolium castaneum]XP_008194810.1 PREDICTED: uncharacterized protein LOC661055 isoform X1 [Tribolium castaneum]KYB26978.1 hypothetical protein TcasGA2_TC033413 [Tribolium castaneum]|eukprot:XP_008194809.1 PREDICTED: uncharacterized protein LOC661055 isoform X1 [Tribolium castaneum]
MSVLNQSGEEQVECPLCMEPLEVDDLNFFPCTCGYQICRFCWHRIRTDENGLCPACRKAYSEDPADFIPLSQEQVAKLKAEKRQRDQQRKAKLSESRKHLASVRVVQKNLVFVVGLPMRLAEPEVLKRHEYFGKFGKIHKVVINQSTAYAGSQGPSASAYVTYMKSDDALRAIESVNNITIDGRLVKSSLGTTKYCSHFMKNQPCPKPDCMYLHDFGDPEASFTKEQMHAGKHQEYEKKLHEALLQRTNNNNTNVTTTETKPTTKSKEPVAAATPTNGTNKDNWPQLNSEKENSKEKKAEKSTESKDKVTKGKSKEKSKEKKEKKPEVKVAKDKEETKKESGEKLSILDDNTSFFSHNSFQKIVPENREDDDSPNQTSPSLLTDSLPDINTSEDWAAAFGFNKTSETTVRSESSQSPIDSFFRTDDFRNIIEASLTTAKNNGYTKPPQPATTTTTTSENYFGKESGLDQHMSKFFMDFHTKNGQKESNGFTMNHNMNGFQVNNYFINQDRLFLLQQKKIEEHLVNLSLKQQNQSYGGFMNGDVVAQNGYGGGFQGQMYQNPQPVQKSRTHAEDDLGFDPFQETQKALAELIANEQSYKAHSNVRGGMSSSQMNGVVHSQSGKSHLPPPPPGFVQPTTHMNSFGSKILPFLNMSNQQISSSTQQQQQNWPSYNSQVQPPPPPQQQQKNANSCNDWKDFDSAIVTTSRHYPIMGPINNPFRSLQQQLGTQQIPNGSLRSHEFTNNAFSNFTQQLQQQQPSYSNYSSHLNNTTQQQQQNLSWFTSELNTQISSPPGFRTATQTSKQQEC